MELLQPTSFVAAVASSKEQLEKISEIISKYCGESKKNNFLLACRDHDFSTANDILDDTVKRLADNDSVSVPIALSLFADKFPQLPNLSSKVSSAFSEYDKVKVIESYRTEIEKILDRVYCLTAKGDKKHENE